MVDLDPLTGTIEFDRAIVLDGGTLAFGFNGSTVSLDTTNLAAPVNTIVTGASVTRNGVVVPGVLVDSVVGNVVTFNTATSEFADGDEIGLLLDGAGQSSVVYDRFYFDDAALAGSLDAGTVIDYVDNTVDGATTMPAPASSSGLVTFDSTVTVSDTSVLVLGFVGGQPVESRRVVVENNTDPLFTKLPASRR